MIDKSRILVWVVPQAERCLDEFLSIERSDIGQRYFVGKRDDWKNILAVARLRGYQYLLQIESTDLVNRKILDRLSKWGELEKPCFGAGFLAESEDFHILRLGPQPDPLPLAPPSYYPDLISSQTSG